LRVVRARDRYEPNARFTTWLYRIVFNLSVNETQRASGRYQLSLDPPTGDEEQGRIEIEDTRDPDPTAAMQSGDVIHAVRRAIAALPENQRMAVVLAKFDDMPYVEIAKVLDSSEKAIKSLIHRARETLRAELAPFLEEDLL
jgi:RNA polymerase sigma-70 factor (ECF subfamily)